MSEPGARRGKRKKPLPPRAKRMKRPARLQSARYWLQTYEGKNIVRGYRRHFGVDLECAVRELQMLGVRLDPAHVEQIRTTVRARAETRRKEKERKARRASDLPLSDSDSDHNFAYIAGHTSGGFPYGVTWEELEVELGSGILKEGTWGKRGSPQES